MGFQSDKRGEERVRFTRLRKGELETHSRFLLGCSSTGAFAGELEALGLTFCAAKEASNGAVSVAVEGCSRAEGEAATTLVERVRLRTLGAGLAAPSKT